MSHVFTVAYDVNCLSTSYVSYCPHCIMYHLRFSTCQQKHGTKKEENIDNSLLLVTSGNENLTVAHH